MIFNVIIKDQKYLEECLYVEFAPEPYKYRGRYSSGCCIYDIDNAENLINEKKEELRVHYYNDICSYDSDFAVKYSL